MPLIQLDVKMLPMKVHYFLYMGGIAPIVSFLPTIAKQLGYSTVVVGTIYSILPILSLITKPIFGAIVDQFRVKKTIFLSFIMISALVSFALMFVPEIPLDTKAELHCHELTYLNVCPNDDLQLSKCDAQRVMKHTTDGLVICQLKCEKSKKFYNELCSTWKFQEDCSTSQNVSDIEPSERPIYSKENIQYNNNDKYVDLAISLQMNHTEQVKNCFFFRVESAFDFPKADSITYAPVCKIFTKTTCEVQCSSEIIMDLITSAKYNGSVLELHQFWIFLIFVCLLWMSQAVVYSLGDTICFDLLGNTPNKYGKQRCWGAIGWGFFTIIAGWLLDIFSSSDVNKNYMPIYYLCLLVLLINFFTASKLEILETKISTNIYRDISKLLTEIKVLGFLLWTILFGICVSIIWQYLFWYVEDIASIYECSTQAWIKTLQGLAMGVQCFGGEVPFFFWSGWIVKRLGHLNCMSLILGAFALRFFAYSLMTNPVWILAIELSNGITFGLGYSVLMSYASVIALPGTESTMIGLVGGVFEGIGVSLGSFIGGVLYNLYGGIITFRIFAFGAAFMCIMHVLCRNFIKSNGKLSLPSFISGSTEYASPNEAIHMLSDS
ncbi:major facilitator superfamily domain-containing protein 6-like isoform X2 [Daktulosphaira vitifoliae]|uniref:major facilitator superfamily domain-containing protein 6-like isoform X2 n=1 Tax=Daktulosphaira vitifoliae TaxID=58002 RepID=UPI0021AAC2D1|nr:major facilitator superfamily domain-containing protein 6-like isoform X2 [Daktulosphaira vitifoliae]